MGVNMNFLMNLIQLGLDVGILALCCEAVFRQKSEIKAKDFFIFPILLVLCAESVFFCRSKYDGIFPQ